MKRTESIGNEHSSNLNRKPAQSSKTLSDVVSDLDVKIIENDNLGGTIDLNSNSFNSRSSRAHSSKTLSEIIPSNASNTTSTSSSVTVNATATANPTNTTDTVAKNIKENHKLIVKSNQRFGYFLKYIIGVKFNEVCKDHISKSKFSNEFNKSDGFCIVTIVVDINKKTLIIENLKTLLNFLLATPQGKKLKEKGISFGISHNNNRVSLEISVTEKIIIEDLSFPDKESNNVKGSFAYLAIYSTFRLQNLCSKTLDEIIDESLDGLINIGGDSLLRFFVNKELKISKSATWYTNPDNAVLREKIHDPILLKARELCDAPENTDINYIYDREDIKKIITEHLAYGDNKQKLLNKLQEFQKDSDMFIKIAKYVEIFTGIFGRFLGMLKHIELEYINIEFYRKKETMLIYFEAELPGFSSFIKEKLVKHFK